jgi:hypothetical protein
MRSCGSMDFGPEGYCDHCGQRRAVGQNRVELDLGPVAAATDRGRHRHHNEDAIAIARLGTTTTVTVVCDGVSSCVRADAASHAAADAGMAAVLDALERPVHICWSWQASTPPRRPATAKPPAAPPACLSAGTSPTVPRYWRTLSGLRCPVDRGERAVSAGQAGDSEGNRDADRSGLVRPG